MPTLSQRWISVLCAVAIFATAPTIRAQDPHTGDTAEQHYQAAVSLFGEGRYREALDQFDAAIAISPEPIFYCNRAVVLVKLREPVEAVESMRICRNTFEGSEAELAQIDAQKEAMEVFVSTVRSRSSEVARDIAAGPLATTTSSTTVIREEGWGLGSTGYLTLALGLAVVGGAVTLDILSADLRSEFENEAAGGPGTSRERYDELKSEYDDRQIIFFGLASAGAVLTTLGGILIAWDVLSDDGPQATVSPTPGGATATVRWTF